ncbi:MAG: hypothetical protein ABIV50_08290, partial [Opitutus sp.]
LRVWFSRGIEDGWAPAAFTAGAWLTGLAVNPASSYRAWSGFIASFDTARANQNWANLFDPLSWLEYVPALATLSVGTSRSLGDIIGAVLTIALVLGIVLAFRRATDRMGALFTLSGSAALLAYTLYTGFNYGWQKTVQFGGAFWAALLPVAVVDALVTANPVNPRVRYLWRTSLVGIIGLFGMATVLNCFDGHKWSQRKILTQDWFNVREYARDHLSSAPVLIDGSTFRMAFFHGMWATYFLADSELYFAARGHENGGYLRGGVANESTTPVPPPAAFLVSRDWADTFDANSPRLLIGDTVALLKTANRVTNWEGLQPENGYPENAYSVVKIDLLPHSRSQLSLRIIPRYRGAGETSGWKIRREADGQPLYETEISGAPPWLITIPLEPNRTNRIQLAADPAPPPDPLPPFMVRDIRIQTVRE